MDQSPPPSPNTEFQSFTKRLIGHFGPNLLRFEIMLEWNSRHFGPAQKFC